MGSPALVHWLGGLLALLGACLPPPPVVAGSEQASAADHPAGPSKPATPPAVAAGRPEHWAREYARQEPLEVLRGDATYYSDSLAGNPTASGEPYEPGAYTAAHRTLPFGTIVRVVRTDTPRVVYVRITDRGPFGHRRRIIDLSRAAAVELDMIRAGVVPVRVEVVQWPPETRAPPRIQLSARTRANLRISSDPR